MKTDKWRYQRADSQVAGIPYICIVYPDGSCFIRLDEYSVEVPINRTHTKTYKVKFKIKAIHKAYKKVLPFATIYVYTHGLSDEEKNQIEELFGIWNLVHAPF